MFVVFRSDSESGLRSSAAGCVRSWIFFKVTISIFLYYRHYWISIVLDLMTPPWKLYVAGRCLEFVRKSAPLKKPQSKKLHCNLRWIWYPIDYRLVFRPPEFFAKFFLLTKYVKTAVLEITEKEVVEVPHSAGTWKILLQNSFTSHFLK